MDRQATRGRENPIGLTEFHYRCLEMRLAECNEAQKEAAAAARGVEIEAPSDHALHGLQVNSRRRRSSRR